MADTKITLTNLNIRQSISILIAKLFLIDVLSAFIVIGFYFALLRGEEMLKVVLSDTPIFLTVFIILGIAKILMDAYIVLTWLNEYYEITPEYIFHKKGIIFRKTEQYRLDHVRGMDVQDSFLGEILNFGTITLFDIRLNKYLDMYLIHNPRRYVRVLKELRPHIETKRDHINLPFMPQENESIGKTS